MASKKSLKKPEAKKPQEFKKLTIETKEAAAAAPPTPKKEQTSVLEIVTWIVVILFVIFGLSSLGSRIHEWWQARKERQRLAAEEDAFFRRLNEAEGFR